MYVRQMYYKLGRLPDQKTSMWDQKIHDKAIRDLKKTSTNCAGDVYLCPWQDQKKLSRSIEQQVQWK